MGDSQLAHNAQLICLLAIVLAVGCTRSTQPLEVPFGGTLTQPTPHRDVQGFARLHVDGLLTQALGGVPAEVSVLEPMVDLGRAIQATPEVEGGAPFALLFFDPEVHGAALGWAYPGSCEDLREPLTHATAVKFSDDGKRLLLAPAEDMDSMMRRLMELVNQGGSLVGREESQPRTQFLPTELWVHEYDGITYLLPALDGARNARQSLAAAGVLSEDALTGEFVRVRVGAALKRLEDNLSQALQLPLYAVANQLQEGSAPHRLSHRARAMERLVHVLLDCLTSAQEVFLHWHADGEVELFVSAQEDSDLVDLLRILPAVQFESLLVPQSAGAVFRLTLQPDAWSDFWHDRVRRRIRWPESRDERSELASEEGSKGEQSVILSIDSTRGSSLVFPAAPGDRPNGNKVCAELDALGNGFKNWLWLGQLEWQWEEAEVDPNGYLRQLRLDVLNEELDWSCHLAAREDGWGLFLGTRSDVHAQRWLRQEEETLPIPFARRQGDQWLPEGDWTGYAIWNVLLSGALWMRGDEQGMLLRYQP